MQLDEETTRKALSRLDGEPPTPSAVDIGRAIAEGRRQRRARSVGAYSATAAATATVLVGVAVASGTWHAPQASPVRAPASSSGPVASSNPTVPATAAAPSGSVPATAPTKCRISALPLPDGRTMALVTGADPTGRFLLGRTYPSPVGRGVYHVVVWDERKPTVVPMRGSDQALDDITSAGVAVGTSYASTGTTAWLYRHGKLTRLPGGDGAEAHAINEANTAVGTRDRMPIIWRSVDQAPVQLPLPAGATVGEARDIDEDGTVVGYTGTAVGPERPYVWLPDGSGHPLKLSDSGSLTGFAYSIRNGWVTGIRDSAAVRWDLRTGEPRAFPQFNIRANTANQYGWQVGTDLKGRGIFLSDAGPVVLPDLVLHKAGELTNIPQTLSDDGRVIGGQADDRTGVIHAVVWTCT